MRFAFLSVLSGMFLLAGVVPATAAESIVDQDRPHAWDLYPRRHTGHRQREISREAIDHFYYNSAFRSRTHGLNPYHRKRYYTVRPYVLLGARGLYGGLDDIDAYEFDAAIGRWVRSEADPDGEQRARGSECMNYSFTRPNYRVPPFGYRCRD